MSEPPEKPLQPQNPGGPAVELQVAEEVQEPVSVGVIDTTKTRPILVSEDRLRLVLTQHSKRLRASDWIAPLGVFLSLGVTLITSDFKKTTLGLHADSWEAIFIVLTVLALVWLAAVIVLRFTKGGTERTIDKCLEDIKRTTSS
jgi:hypothetical protein